MGYLFVYGTLLENENNPGAKFLEKNAKFLCKGFFYGKLYEIDGYPGAVLSNSHNEKVFGNIYKLHDEEKVLSYLDKYEEIGEHFPAPYEYKREIITVYSPKENFKCWVYLYNHPTHHLERIVSGYYKGNE